MCCSLKSNIYQGNTDVLTKNSPIFYYVYKEKKRKWLN